MISSLSQSKILKAIIALTVIFQSGHALQTIISADYLLYIPAAIAVIMLLTGFSKTNLKSETGMLLVFMMMIFLTALTEFGGGMHFYIHLLIVLLAAYCIVQLYSFESVASFYLNLMTVVAVVAFVAYFLVNNTGLLSVLPKMTNVNDVDYRVGVIFNFIPAIPDRNCGMFWEPGLFATHLTIAMVLEIITKEKKNVFRLIIFSLCIFTANSSAGFVLWFLCMVLLFVHTKNTYVNPIKATISIVLLILAIWVFVNFDSILELTYLGENEYFQKLSSKNIYDSSRSKAIIHNLKMFSTSPILGAGYTTVTRNMDYVADTSTSTYLLSIFGILAVFYTLSFVYGIMKLEKDNIFSKIIIVAIALIIVNKEPHYQILFTWILMFYLIKGACRNKNEYGEMSSYKKEV